MTRPQAKTRDSPSLLTRRPLSGPNATRTTAKALATNDTAVTPTSKLRAKIGKAGATMP